MPTQDRAVATVEAILEATARILVEEGGARLSTNKIAKRAGVSVGTLYQYFPDKEAIVVALGESTLDRQFRAFEQDLLRMMAEESDFEASIRVLIRQVLHEKRMTPELSRVLLTFGAVGNEDWNQEWLRRQRALIRSALHVHRDKVRPADLDVLAYVITTAFEFVLQDAIVHQPHLLRDGRLADELSELAIRYLRCDAEPPA